MSKCPTCKSPAPHRHPATMFEGEVFTCIDDYHLTPTNQNKPEYIAMVHAERQSRLPVTRSLLQNNDVKLQGAQS